MKVAIVTSSEFSYASLFLKKVLPSQTDFIVILNHPPRRKLLSFIRKVRKTGALGAAVGFLARSWYNHQFESVTEIARDRGFPVFRIDGFEVTSDVRGVLMSCDLGISMGNGYIPKRFFGLFKFGMINIHHEVLPEYPGAQSVVWPLIKNIPVTGFSIHFINSGIDRGKLIAVERRPIELMDSLSHTVRHNYFVSLQSSVDALIHLLSIPIERWKRTSNSGSLSYSTPRLTEWLLAYRNHNRLRNSIGSH